MSSSTAVPSSPSGSALQRAGDSFAIGVLVMLLVSIVQRCVGLIRGIGFAYFLTDVELGQWALANSFFVIAVPIAVLGLPGSFGKFVEHFRTRALFAKYFRRVAAVSLLGSLATSASILVYPGAFSWLIFGEPTSTTVTLWCVVTLVSVIAFSFVGELTAAFRQVKTVSHMQFAQSASFAVLGLGLVAVEGSWWVLLPSFAISHWIAILPGIWKLYIAHGDEFLDNSNSDPQTISIWQRILPYAATLWVVNFASNMFEVGDRYMLLHLVPGGETVGQGTVGQYHCARILPNLLTSLAVMLGGVLLPYLSADWESGQQDRITARMRQIVQAVCISFLGLSVAALVAAPLLFQVAFSGRYELALAVLPLALLQATWAGVFLVAEPYLLCAERGKQLLLLLVLALCVNLGLNWALIQTLGLYGALTATAIANLLALLLLFWRMRACGCNLGWGTVVLTITPLALVGGAIPATAALTLIVFAAGRTEWLLSAQDREQIDELALQKLERFGIRLQSIWP